MHRSRFNETVIACAWFAATVFLFEAALYAPGFRPGAATYLAVVAALTLGIALALTVAATFLAGTAAPHAAVVTLAALAALEAELRPVDAARAVGVALVLLVALAIDGELRRRPRALAVVAAAAVCGAFRVWPRLTAVLDIDARGMRAAVLEVVVFAGCVAVALGWSAVRRRWARRLAAETAMAIATLALVAVVVSAADAHRGARRKTLPARAEPSAAARPSILVLLLDTVGANRLSIYGHSRPTTPALERLVDTTERAALYPLAFSTAPWTVPSHGSLFTGQLASDIDALRGARSGSPRVRLPKLSQTLSDRGYRTAAVIANPMVTSHTSLLDGFDVVVRWPPLHPLRLTPGELVRARWMPRVGVRAIKPTPAAEVVNRTVLDLVSECGQGPCFVFANYMDAHLPYAPASPHAGRWADGSHEELERAAARHDEAIAGLDAALGTLLEQLDASGALERWWIVITSDHGEAFGEHGYIEHGGGLHVEQTRVPLLIVPPLGDRLTVRHDPVSLIDVAATIAALGGVESFGAGDDLRRPVGAAAPARMESAGETDPRGQKLPPSRAVVVGPRQLIEWAGRWELYDLEADRAQQHDLAAAAPDEVERLRALLPRGVAGRGEAAADDHGPAALSDDAARRNLRALGYLD